MVLAALAISLLAIAGFPQTAFAGTANANNARAEQAAERKAAANGQAKKTDAAPTTDNSAQPVANNENDSAGTTTHGAGSGPGGQTCDGDPSNDPGDGGVYENTCSSYPKDNTQGSDNGAGDGKATGKPCEGCVGNADDKNPGGQAGGGPVDHNNGYECDMRGAGANQGNNGIGFGNPAHTGCTTTPPCVDSDTVDCTPCDPTPTQNADCTEKCKPTSTQNADCTEKCKPTSTQNADCTEKCVPTATQDSTCKEKTCPAGQMNTNGKCECPAGQVMGTDATCSTPCVEGTGNPACTKADEGSVASTAVLGEQLGRLDVLGVAIEAPTGAVAPAALARTGGFELTALVQAGLILAMVGLGMTVLGRRRKMIDIASRLGS